MGVGLTPSRPMTSFFPSDQWCHPAPAGWGGSGPWVLSEYPPSDGAVDWTWTRSWTWAWGYGWGSEGIDAHTRGKFLYTCESGREWDGDKDGDQKESMNTREVGFFIRAIMIEFGMGGVWEGKTRLYVFCF